MPKPDTFVGYKAPTPIDGYAMRCYCIEIPDVEEYRIAFLSQIDHMMQWVNWQRDTDRTAAQVAAYLRSVILPQMEKDFVCNCLLFRNDPHDLPQVETSCDNGVTWVKAFRLDVAPVSNDTIINMQVNLDAIIRLEILNRYDGADVTTININCPSDFYNGDNSADRNMALCMAVKGYVEKQVNEFRFRAAQVLAIAGIIGAATLFAPVLVIPLALGAGILALISQTSFNASGDVGAVNAVTCCMVDYLTGKAVTRANFQASLSACGFTVGSNAAILRDIVADSFGDMGNWAAFIDAVGNAYIQAQAGVEDCPCNVACETYPDGTHWTLNDGSIVVPGTIQYSATGFHMTYAIGSVKNVTYVQWIDNATAANTGTWYVDYYNGAALVRHHVLYDGSSSAFVDFVEMSDGAQSVDRVEIHVALTANLGVMQAHDIMVCAE